MKHKKVLISGITGQDGSYLAEFLLGKNYEVHGIIRRVSTFNTERIEHLEKYKISRELFLHYGDLSDASSLENIFSKVKPDEVYNLGAQSHVRISFDIPQYTSDITGLGTLRMLDAMKKYSPKARFYQASSSEMFGDVLEDPQSEKTPFNPQSPYGISKVFAHETACRYREAYGLFISCGILFNHESSRRGKNFVTRKITYGIANIAAGRQQYLTLGNLDAKRDWGYAPEFCEAMWVMLQQERPDDFVIGTGEVHSVREFVENAFECIGINIKWIGKGIKEQGVDQRTGKVLVKIDPKYFRPNEVGYLRANSAKARRILKWIPETNFNQLVKKMLETDINLVKNEI